MLRSIPHLLAVVLVIAAIGPAQAGKVYDIIPYDGFAPGWAVGGSITTDGTIGPIDDDNFVDYSISVTHPGGGFTLTPFNSFTLVFDVNHVPIIATTRDLIFSPSDPDDLPAQLSFNGFAGRESVAFSGGFAPDPGFIWLNGYQNGTIIDPPEFAEPFSIARSSVVPEPSTAWLLSVSCTAGTLVRRRRLQSPK